MPNNNLPAPSPLLIHFCFHHHHHPSGFRPPSLFASSSFKFSFSICIIVVIARQSNPFPSSPFSQRNMSSSSSSSSSSLSLHFALRSSSFPPDPISSPRKSEEYHEKEEGEEEREGSQSPNGLKGTHENLFEAIAKLVGIEGAIGGKGGKEAEESGGEDGQAELDEKNNGMAEEENSSSRPLIGNFPPNQPSGSSSSSSSRRKNGNPTRISDGEGGEIGKSEGREGVKEEPKEEEEGEEAEEEEEEIRRNGQEEEEEEGSVSEGGQMPTIPQQQPVATAIGAAANHHPFFPQFPSFGQSEDQQRRLYAQLMGQNGNQAAQLQQGQIAEMQRNFMRLAQNLKEELSGLFAGAIDKDQILGDFSASEAQAHAGRLLAALSMAARQHQWAAEQLGMFGQGQLPSPWRSAGPFPPPGRLFPPPSAQQTTTNAFHAFLAQNPLMAAMAAAQQFPVQTAANGGGPGGGGIFPSATAPSGFVPPPSSRSFAPTMPLAHQPPMASNAHHATESDGSPRKKRAKVTDSVRGPRSSLHPCREPANSSTSERSTPQGFPPTMVPLSSTQLLFRSSERIQQGGSPSGDDSEGNSANGEMHPHRTQLTHVHLRKAKLMFFYQRYPSSTLLKSYFPDVHFTKHNTAQLVKWFSNFREFYYMQMEKYAKQALAEGVKYREELLVNQDSEIFKQLNIHYNKNGVFQPPERLQFVVQETLREFFSALQQQKDAEASWKKAIYKVIQQLDEPIPEFFKHPEFVEMLERTN